MAKRKTVVTGEAEVEHLESEPKAAKGMDLTGGLAFVTCLALLAGIVLGQKILQHYYNAGMFGGR